MRLAFGTAVSAIGLLAAASFGQTAGTDAPPEAPSESTPDTTPEAVQVSPPPADEADAKKWSLSISASVYIVPDDRDYVQPTISADRDWLHLEARYNYEAADTGSVWVGYNLGGGKEFTWAFTPMIGGVFGEINGFAPGFELTLNWWKLELYSESEYVVDTADSSNSFFYTWTELSLSPVDWFRFGIVAQRTQLYEGDRDIQRGVLVGFVFEKLDVTAYLFNPDDDKPLFVLTVGVSF